MEFNVLCTVSFYYQPEINKNRDANFPFFDSDRGFQGSNRYHFEKHFSPGLCAYLMLTVFYSCPKCSQWKGCGGMHLVPSSAQAFGKLLVCMSEAAATSGGSSQPCVGTTCCPGEGT